MIRVTSTPLSTKTILQRLPPRVFQRLEATVNATAHLNWQHFDAGVVKVRDWLMLPRSGGMRLVDVGTKAWPSASIADMLPYASSMCETSVAARQRCALDPGTAGQAVPWSRVRGGRQSVGDASSAIVLIAVSCISRRRFWPSWPSCPQRTCLKSWSCGAPPT